MKENEKISLHKMSRNLLLELARDKGLQYEPGWTLTKISQSRKEDLIAGIEKMIPPKKKPYDGKDTPKDKGMGDLPKDIKDALENAVKDLDLGPGSPGSKNAYENALKNLKAKGGNDGNGDEAKQKMQPSNGSLEQMIMEKILPILEEEVLNKVVEADIPGNVKEEVGDVGEKVRKAIQNAVPKKIEVKGPSGKTIKLDRQHCAFEDLLKFIGIRSNLYMVGPTGSGKTRGAFEASKALDLPFYALSVGPMTTQSQIMGFYNGHGEYVSSMFRKAYENGGVFLFDEIDAANATVLTCMNQGTSADECAFPDAMVKKHKDFVCLAAANTYGRGADRIFVGRNQLDGATLDRFPILEWNYDEGLELEISGNVEWTKHVQNLRASAEKMKVRHIISPRASIVGAQMLEAGMKKSFVEESVIWKGLDSATVKRIKSNAKEA
jgi:hypothetical protein